MASSVMTNEQPVYLSSLLSLHAPPRLSSSHTDPLGVHLSPSHLFVLPCSVPSDGMTLSLLDSLVTSYPIYEIGSSCNCSGEPSVSSPGQPHLLLSAPESLFWALIHCYNYCSHLSLPALPWRASRAGKMFSCGSFWHRICHRGKKERRWGRERRRKRKEVVNTNGRLVSTHFPLLWLSVWESPFLCLVLASGWDWPHPKGWALLTQRNHRISTPWIRISSEMVYSPVRNIFWVFRERQTSFDYQRYSRYFFLPDQYE